MRFREFLGVIGVLLAYVACGFLALSLGINPIKVSLVFDLVCGLVLYLWVRKQRFHDKACSYDGAPLVFSLFAVAFFCGHMCAAWMISSNLGFGYNTYSEFASSDVVAMTLLALIGAPLFEEVFFRGVVFRLFSSSGVLFGAFVSSLLFSGLHMTAPHILATFMFGMLMCYVYWRYDCIKLTIFFHVLYNLASMAINGFDIPEFFVRPEVWGVMSVLWFIYFVRHFYLRTQQYQQQ